MNRKDKAIDVYGVRNLLAEWEGRRDGVRVGSARDVRAVDVATLAGDVYNYDSAPDPEYVALEDRKRINAYAVLTTYGGRS